MQVLFRTVICNIMAYAQIYIHHIL